MTYPLVPVDSRRTDWPRLVADAINRLTKRGKWPVTLIGTVAVAETLGGAFAGGVRQVSVSLSGIAVGDALIIAPAGALTADYAVLGAVGDGAGTFQATIITPALGMGDSYSISCRIYRIG